MTEPEHAALEHIRRVVDTILGEPVPASVPAPAADTTSAPAAAAPAILSVPYVAQLGAGADKFANDSGAASGVMLVRAYTDKTPTVDEFFAKAGQTTDKALTLMQVVTGLTTYGVTVEQRASLKLADLALILVTGRPVIVLVKYSVLNAAGLTPETDEGPHCLVVVGLDVKNIYVHDPLRKDASGQGQGIPWLTFYQAWSQVVGYDRAAIIPRVALVRRMRITAATLNIRADANPNSSIVGTVKAGDAIEVTVQKDGWGKIGDGKWINLSYAVDI
jgi:hypothetical protein